MTSLTTNSVLQIGLFLAALLSLLVWAPRPKEDRKADDRKAKARKQEEEEDDRDDEDEFEDDED